MEIIKYNYEKYLKDAFIEMNKAWIIKDFKLEDEDMRVLSSVDTLVKNGASIYFTLLDGIPVSTVMLINLGAGEYELAKFATKEGYFNLGAGKFLLEYVLNEARNFSKRIIIATNKRCKAAIHLYEKYGFKEINDLISFGFSSDRVDICYELIY